MLLQLWRIDMLGGLRIRHGEAGERRLRTLKAGALLSYLALQRGRACSREELREFFWPVEGESSLSKDQYENAIKLSRQNLRQTLSTIRRQLELPGYSAGYILTSQNSYMLSLAPEAYTTDVAEFEEAYQSALNTTDPDERLRLLQRAVNLYQGDFLPGLYDDWVLRQRDYLSERHLHAQRLLTESLSKTRRQELRDYSRYGLNATDDSASQDQERGFPENSGEVATRIRQWHLPTLLTRCVGRSAEIADLAAFFSGPEPARCVTLMGHGGIGKTRLAVEAARRLPEKYDIVAFVPLAEIRDARLLLSAIASALRLPSPSSQPLRTQVVEHLQQWRSLLILDNLEHIAAEVAPMITTLLKTVPTLHCLLTSRRRLAVEGEVVYPVSPLSIPDTAISDAALLKQVRESESAELFRDRACQVHPDFAITKQNAALMGQLCLLLEGVPLAIEIAAAFIGRKSLKEMVTQLTDRRALLHLTQERGEERHRSLQVVLEWSSSLLSKRLQQFLFFLSVFQGGWTLAAAESICEEPDASDYLEMLRLHSLISSEQEYPDVPLRFQMLETVRQFGQSCLSDERRRRISDAHAAFFHEFCRDYPAGETTPERCARLTREYGNIHATLSWYTAEGLSPEKATEIASDVEDYWFFRGAFDEQKHWLTKILSQKGDAKGNAAYFRDRAIVLYEAGKNALMTGDMNAATDYMKEALDAFRRIGEKMWIGATINKLGVIAMHRRDYADARTLLEEGGAISREGGDWAGVAHMHKCLGCLLIEQGTLEGVKEHFDTALTLYQQNDNQIGICMMLTELGRLAILEERLTDGEAILNEALEKSWQHNSLIHVRISLRYLALAAEKSGDRERAAHFIAEAKRVAQSASNMP